MIRDPLYVQIRRALRDLKAGDAFEPCANDVLRKFHPSLSPREGGDDAGLDGKAADPAGGSIQLICTTSREFKAIKANLTKSIRSNLKSGGKSHACILATPQRLTNHQKRSLEARAHELGRPLSEIYDQAWFAQLLYREPRWLKDLLGLTGTPPSLSLLPITNRPLSDDPPVGRGVDLARFKNLEKDKVLIGQPGSGKTHLLFTAAKQFKGRFVLDEDFTHIADSVRSIQPSFLIVDDAHSRLDFIKRLTLLRQQICADFRIVASCWPGQQDVVCAALQISCQDCQTLEGLTQKQIKEVIQAQKIFGPEHLVAEIIHQSQGKPGLAVTLCRLCWESGSSREVMLGTALARDVRLSFEPLLGRAATDLLGCFSIGGDAGMSLESVAHLLGTNVLEVRRTAEQLSAAGVLDVVTEKRIAVNPPRLRQALVRDIFLNPLAPDLAPYLSAASDYAATTRVLIEAKLIGGVLDDGLLRERLQKLAGTHEQSAFEEYAHLGRQQAEWILMNFPDRLPRIAAPALNNTPEKTLQLLLDRAANTYKERASQGWAVRAENVVPEIKTWILAAQPNDNDASKRRELLAAALEKWFAENKDPLVAAIAASLVLSIKHEATSTPPGEPMTVTIYWGVLAQNQLSRIAALWPKVLPILRQALPGQGREIANIFHEWIHPNFAGKGAPPEYEQESRRYARQMMADLLEAFAGKWTFHHHLHNYANKLGLLREIQIEQTAEVLYPPRDSSDWKADQARRTAAADELASQLKNKDQSEVAHLLTRIEKQARAANILEPSWGTHICRQIAKATDKRDDWVRALQDSDAPAHLLQPFLENAPGKKPSATEIGILLESPRPDWQMLGVSLVLKFCHPGTPIWQKANPLFKNFTGLQGCVLRKEIGHDNLKTLLEHDDPKVSGIVAASMWAAKAEPEIPAGLTQTWKQAIVTRVDEEHQHILEDVFPKYPDLAYEWIEWRLEGIRTHTRPFYFGLRYDSVLPAALRVLTPQQKRELLDKCPQASYVSELVRSLVGRDIELFLHLLSREDVDGIKLDPLRCDFGTGLHTENVIPDFDEGWQRMALAALERGFSETDIIAATQRGGYTWSGPMSEMFAAKAAAFEKLLQCSEIRLQTIGRIGFEQFSTLRDEMLSREKRSAIGG